MSEGTPEENLLAGLLRVRGIHKVANPSNSLHDENDDANDNDRSNDPVSEHFRFSLCVSLVLQ